MPNKIIIKEVDSHGVGDIIIANEDGAILSQSDYTWENDVTSTVLDLANLMIKYQPETLHFVNADDVNHYLAMAPIAEYPHYDDPDEDEEDE